MNFVSDDMGWFKDLFSSEKEKLLKSKYEKQMPNGLKWILVSLVVNFQGPSKKEIIEIANDISNIINNTYSLINEKGEYVGYTNPYLGLNLAMCSESKKGKIHNKVNLYARIPIPNSARSFFPKDFPDGKTQLTSKLSRPFYPLIKKSGKKWTLTFIATKTSKKDKTNLHSIENLNHDSWMLAGASNLICEKYDIPIPVERPTFSPIMLSGAPAIELHDHLLNVKYHVHDRIASELKNPELDNFVLGHGDSIFEVIKKISQDQPNSDWTKAVAKLL